CAVPLHPAALGHSATHHVPRRCPPKVMEDPPRDVRSFARRRPGLVEGLYGAALRAEEHRAIPERLAGPLPLGLRPLSPENRDERQGAPDRPWPTVLRLAGFEPHRPGVEVH